MGQLRRRRGLALAAVTVIGLVTVVTVAAASRASTRHSVEVFSPVSPYATSAGASEATASDTTIATNTTLATETTTTLAQPEPTRTSTADTAVASTPSSEPTTGAPPVAGTYFGVEHFSAHAGRCAVLDHHIVGTFSVSDGTTWDFRQDYCGTFQGDLWSGDGTFSLTAPDGAAITGTVTERNIRIPSPGVPYTLDITGGAQRFAGASGTCRLDNHLQQIAFGLQHDFGSFTCNIAL
ncbi:MAG: hypothetical protein QOG50_2770 [Actinomycetota bacterium]|nr:hypothetical protein [Actinomycetota bacterium]